jgi:hypothetical protein
MQVFDAKNFHRINSMVPKGLELYSYFSVFLFFIYCFCNFI